MTAPPSPFADSPSYAEQLARLRAYFATGATREVAFRREALRRFQDGLKRHEARLLEASYADLRRSPAETYGIDLGPTHHELSYVRRRFAGWGRSRWGLSQWHSFLGATRVMRQPYGVVLIVGAWNYPYYLTFGPLVSALAAGNCVVLKPSEVAPHSSAAIRDLVADTFAPDYVTVIEGGVEETTQLLRERFDYLFYTGSTEVGRIMMRAAAEHLTPVTLELGGKSPCIVDHSANLALAAQRIAWGKFINAGQTCVAPDYLLVHERVAEPLIGHLGQAIARLYGTDPQQSPDLARIVGLRHFDRLVGYLADGTPVIGGQHDRATRYIAPTVLTGVDPESPVMQAEIFGPILPLLTYRTDAEALAFVNARERPLALYIFGERPDFTEQVLQGTHSGGACVNETVMHLADSRLPFGGVGQSGMGQYHGRYGYETFSHLRGVHYKSTWFDLPVRYPPYTATKNRLVRFFMR